MDLTGKVIKILEPVGGVSSRTGESWVKNSFVLETVGQQYTKKCVVTVFGADKWRQMGIVEGAQYQVSFDIDAHEYNGRWFSEVRAFKAVRIDGAQASVLQGTQAAAPKPSAGDVVTTQSSGGSADDLPF